MPQRKNIIQLASTFHVWQENNPMEEQTPAQVFKLGIVIVVQRWLQDKTMF